MAVDGVVWAPHQHPTSTHLIRFHECLPFHEFLPAPREREVHRTSSTASRACVLRSAAVSSWIGIKEMIGI